MTNGKKSVEKLRREKGVYYSDDMRSLIKAITNDAVTIATISSDETRNFKKKELVVNGIFGNMLCSDDMRCFKQNEPCNSRFTSTYLSSDDMRSLIIRL